MTTRSTYMPPGAGHPLAEVADGMWSAYQLYAGISPYASGRYAYLLDRAHWEVSPALHVAMLAEAKPYSFWLALPYLNGYLRAFGLPVRAMERGPIGPTIYEHGKGFIDPTNTHWRLVVASGSWAPPAD